MISHRQQNKSITALIYKIILPFPCFTINSLNLIVTHCILYCSCLQHVLEVLNSPSLLSLLCVLEISAAFFLIVVIIFIVISIFLLTFFVHRILSIHQQNHFVSSSLFFIYEKIAQHSLTYRLLLL